VGDLLALLREAGFTGAEQVAFTGVETSRYTCAATFRAVRPG